MNKLDEWKKNLRIQGIRATRQRLLILQELVEASRPLTAGDIFNRLKERFPKLRLSTVYRNLNFFNEKQIVRKVNLERNNQQYFFELLDGEHHHHLVCVNCGEVVKLSCPLQGYEDIIREKTDFTVIEHKIKIYGICPECKKGGMDD